MSNLQTMPGSVEWPRSGRLRSPVSQSSRVAGILLTGVAITPMIAKLPAGLTLVMSLNCLIVLILAAYASGMGRWKRLGVGVVSSIGIAGASFSGLASSMQEMAMAYAALMLCMKTMEVHSIRDLRVVAILGLVPPLICLMDEPNTLVIITTILIVPASMGMLMFVCDVEAQEQPKTGAWWRYPAKSLVRMAWALPVAMLVFYLLPRIDSPIWGQRKNSATTGISDTMSPGKFNELLNNPSVAFRALFPEPVPLGFSPYWRGPVLTHFDGSTWSVGVITDAVEGGARDTGTLMPYTMILEPQRQPYIPTLDIPVSIDPSIGQINRDLTITSTSRWDRSRTIKMTAALDGQNNVQIGMQERAANLALPANSNPRTVAMAKQWRAEAKDESQFINKAQAFFKSQLTYTLEPPLLGDQRIDELLFETKQGFCEHFSSAFAVIMRAGGVPTRVVTGYQGGALNEKRDFYTVQQLYAHAWTEIWLEGEGWTRIDPTGFVISMRPVQQADERNFLQGSGLIKISTWFRNAWGSSVGDFDASSQRYIAARLFNSDGLPFSPNLMRLLMAIIGMLIITLALIAIISFRPKGKAGPADPLEAAWQDACDRLRKIESSIVPSITPHKAAALGRVLLDRQSAKTLNILAQRYSQAQYAPQGNTERAQLARQIRRWRPKRKK